MARNYRIDLMLKAALGMLPKVERVKVNVPAYSTDRHEQFLAAVNQAEAETSVLVYSTDSREDSIAAINRAKKQSKETSTEESCDQSLHEMAMSCGPQIDRAMRFGRGRARNARTLSLLLSA